jgi:hypothetical protein
MIKFETKLYYLEAERLSKNPKIYQNTRNPILTYMPENMNFKPKTLQD